MSLRVRGPRAQRFVDLLGRYTGLTLVLDHEMVSIDRNSLLIPSESQTLQDLVEEIVHSPNVVEVVAFGGVPDPMLNIDTFLAMPEFHRPRRSVYVADLEEIERMSPILARGLMGHILREYYGASRPPGQQPSEAYADNHVAAMRTEAQIVGDLLDRPIWTGHVRPWEHTYGTINV